MGLQELVREEEGATEPVVAHGTGFIPVNCLTGALAIPRRAAEKSGGGLISQLVFNILGLEDLELGLVDELAHNSYAELTKFMVRFFEIYLHLAMLL